MTRRATTAAPIGIFDSGIGGLSVVAPIRALLPDESLIYVADSAHCPYGEKADDYLRERAVAIAGLLLDLGCKAIVVACNTATVATVRMLRERLTIPVVGIEPAVKPAAAATRSGVIGVLATRATLRSDHYRDLLARHAADLRVLSEACPGWVEAVEQGRLDGPETEALVERHVRPLVAAGADTLVLGCTHFPFLRPLVERVAGPGIAVLDTGEPVARQLRRRLEEATLLSAAAAGVAHRFLTSGDDAAVSAFARRIWPEIGVVERFGE